MVLGLQSWTKLSEKSESEGQWGKRETLSTSQRALHGDLDSLQHTEGIPRKFMRNELCFIQTCSLSPKLMSLGHHDRSVYAGNKEG